VIREFARIGHGGPLLTRHYLAGQAGARAVVLILDSSSQGTYLYRYDATGAFVGDIWHANVDDAHHQATFEYEGDLGPWRVGSGVIGARNATTDARATSHQGATMIPRTVPEPFGPQGDPAVSPFSGSQLDQVPSGKMQRAAGRDPPAYASTNALHSWKPAAGHHSSAIAAPDEGSRTAGMMALVVGRGAASPPPHALRMTAKPRTNRSTRRPPELLNSGVRQPTRPTLLGRTAPGGGPTMKSWCRDISSEASSVKPTRSWAVRARFAASDLGGMCFSVWTWVLREGVRTASGHPAHRQRRPEPAEAAVPCEPSKHRRGLHLVAHPPRRRRLGCPHEGPPSQQPDLSVRCHDHARPRSLVQRCQRVITPPGLAA
jgi:hypothetical protein